MSKIVDCEYTQEPICPHCGHALANAWERGFNEDATTVICGNCEKDFDVYANISISYSTCPSKPPPQTP